MEADSSTQPDQRISSTSGDERKPSTHSAVQIVNVNPETRTFELDLDALEGILLQDKVRDKPVAVVSIAGDFRKGKSFLLNFFLSYLTYGDSEWINKKDEPLKGFSWRGGSERDTTGILMWSEPFIVKRSSGEEVAILLMDTQGAFDSEYTVRDSATVFALSTMTSSIQVFNLLHNLQEDNLQVLEIFTEYGRLALEATDETPFQKLVFLIRDWSFPYEHPYGLKGGNGLLDKKLAIRENQPTQLQRVRRHIRSCFSDIECFLMPHPGSKVATNPKFDGRLTDIDPEFVAELQVLVPLLLDPTSIVVKEIGGQKVTGRQLLEYFKVYINIFKGGLPEPTTILEATAEANNLAALAASKELYIQSIESLCGSDKPFVYPPTLKTKHEEFKSKSMELFQKTKKMGGKEFSDTYFAQLEIDVETIYERYESQNKIKSIYNRTGTILVLFVMISITYVFSQIIHIIGLNNFMAVGFFINLLQTVLIGILITYSIFKSTGKYEGYIHSVELMGQQASDIVVAQVRSTLVEQAVK